MLSVIHHNIIKWRKKNEKKNTHTVFKQIENPIKIVGMGKCDTISMTTLFFLFFFGTDTSIKSGRVKIVLWAQTFPVSEMIRSCTCFPRVSKMSTLRYNWANSVIVKNAMTMSIIHNIFNFRDTEVVICIILVLLFIVDGLD